MTESVTPFSYAQLTPAVAELVRGKADEIRRSTPRMLDAALAIGKALIAVKAALPHGQFLPWLGAEFSWSERTAQRYMSAAEAFEGKSDSVSHFTLPTVYALAAPANESVRKELADRVSRGDKPSEAEALTIIGASRKMRRLEAEEAAKEREKRKEGAAWERLRRSHQSPQAKRRVTLAQKRAAAETMREQQEIERHRQTAQEAAELLLKLLPEAGLRELVSLFNKAGWLPEHFQTVFFDALKKRLRDLGWDGNAAQLVQLNIRHSTIPIVSIMDVREATDKQGGENVVRPRFRR
jgi:hypothetical protein